MRWLESVSNLAHARYDDPRFRRSSPERIAAAREALSGHVDPSRSEVLGHGLRDMADAGRVFRLGLQAPNRTPERLLMTVFEAGKPLEMQPDEAFDGLLQWPFGRRQAIVLVEADPSDPGSLWRDIRDDEERSYLATAIGGVRVTVDPSRIAGVFDASSMSFTPNPHR